MKFYAALILVCLVGLAQAVDRQAPVSRPGGVARLDLGPADAPAPSVRFQGRRVLVIATGSRWQALVGIPLEAEPGWLSAEVTDARGHQREQPLEIVGHDYPTQHLRVKNRRHVDPDPADLARWSRESDEQNTAKRAWREPAPQSAALQLPVAGRRSSAFGLRRTFNGKPRRPHSGLDLAVPTGTPVAAPAAGRVSLTGDYFFNGRTVFVDHGHGLISMLCHLSRVDVSVGDEVAAGDIVGRAGATGRATGPHVHWSVFLNGTAIDPDALLGPS
ncbi:MAG: peptidoglycan DD-metalloendopeptidase family protein [Zoogloeaceae bacterium]|nr:peptidoglycan DD-metalloendopeptidase family protein [Rhodocyclaceae bacterium]MCP5237965.1 peptidoglycan DD-metalloendopeptidase family protein [Zoogloeaceae bacterium]